MGIKPKKYMFNEQLKKAYIEHSVAVSESKNSVLYERGLINRFLRSCQYEEQIGKDICEMNQCEAVDFLTRFLCGGTLYQDNTISTLRSYVEWVISNKLVTVQENPFNRIKVSDIDMADSYTNTMVKNEEDLVESLDTVLDDIKRDTADNAKWCIFLLIFAGIQFKDIFFLKKEDVDLKSNIIQQRDDKIHLSPVLCEILNYYLKMDELQKIGKNDSEYSRPIIDEGYLISNTKSFGENRDKMRLSYTSGISLAMKLCSKNLTPDSIYDSGVFYRMFLKEQKTGEIDCIEYLMARKHQKAVITTPERIKKICVHEYMTWKRAFEL